MIKVPLPFPAGATVTSDATVSIINFAHAPKGTELHSYGKSPQAYGMSAEKLGLDPDDNVVFVGNFDFQFRAGDDPINLKLG